MKLAIFGASVSHQALDHVTKEVTGYAEVLRCDYATRLGLSELRQITYSGGRASDAGLIWLEQVVSYAPKICLFEPLIEDTSRGTQASKAEIEYIYRRLLDADILPVTLMLPNPVRRVPDMRPEYARYKAVCDRLGLPIIRVDLTGVEGIEEKFKGIHTRKAGADIYAAQIAGELAALGDPAACLAGLSVPSGFGQGVQVQQLPPPDPAPKKFTGLTLTLQAAKGLSTRIRLIQLQTIGPLSPVLDVTARGKTSAQADDWTSFVSEQQSVWDPYCHYERQSFVILSDLQSEGHELIELTVACAKADPDYAACRREVPSWPAAQDRYLKPLGPLTLVSDAPLEAKLKRIWLTTP